MMMAEQKKPSCLLKLMVIMAFMLVCTVSDSNQDKQECASSLVGLATCLPYVGGTAKSPTPDCCSGLKGVLKTDKKCLCLVIKDRNDPDLGLTINVTLALGLPTVCNAPANISACPDLLHLDPNSPDAKVFFQGGHASAAAPAGGPAAGPSSAPGGAGAGAPGSSGQSKSDSGRVGHGLEVLATILVLWTFSVYFAS